MAINKDTEKNPPLLTLENDGCRATREHFGRKLPFDIIFQVLKPGVFVVFLISRSCAPRVPPTQTPVSPETPPLTLLANGNMRYKLQLTLSSTPSLPLPPTCCGWESDIDMTVLTVSPPSKQQA